MCRQHALVLELELGDQESELIGTIDRAASRSQDPLAMLFAGAFNGVLGRIFVGNQQRAQQPSSPPPRSSRPQPRPPLQPRPPDPSLRAREILGFEPQERLTLEIVQKRKQALARVFHPDMVGGSEAQMKRINAAADTLLAKLS